MKTESVRIISLGGFAKITKNMFVYETKRDILIVDCGLGFPEENKPEIDVLIPDISYLKDKMQKIRGIVLSHGHDDHLGSLPYIFPQLPKKIPIYGPQWAIALSKLKFNDFGLQANFQEIKEGSRLKLGQFLLEFIQVTHSIPDTLHLIIKTPVGIFYHAADFKLDLKPVMGEPTDQRKIRAVGKKGVLCMLSDCLRAEFFGFTPPESKLEEMFEEEMNNCWGKFIVTTMSSNISRLKQAIEISLRHNRKIVLVGKTIEKNIELAKQLKYLNFPSRIFLSKKEMENYPPNRLTLLVAGSQAQVGSALDRIVRGKMEAIKIQPGDKVIFSTDYIPGNETAIYRLIDDIYRAGGEAVYQDIHTNVHVSGHGSQGDLGKLIEMVNPRWLVPIGGNFRHLVVYQKLAERKGFKKDRVILADDGQILEFLANGRVQIAGRIKIKEKIILKAGREDNLL